MCGIAGHIGTRAIDEERVSSALGLMKNRGPDHQDSVAFRHGDLHVSLLHSRLSIIDLEPRSNQPFTIGDCTLVFNGEIYNYIELRQRLRARGVTFRTESDTEVLLQSYLTFGADCVNDFEGMWAFAIYDRRSGVLLLSRDRFAEKPLYYAQTGGGVFFGSEIKFIRALMGRRPPLNLRHLSRYLVNGYKSLYKTSDTFFEGVCEVPYATALSIGADLEPHQRRYWNPTHQPVAMTLDEAVEGFRERLYDSVRLRLRADVPMAFCLSGGVDSGALASIAAKEFNHNVHAFSIIDPDPRYDESANIQATVDDLSCEHATITIERSPSLDELEHLIRYHDAPVYTISYYIHAMLSRAMAERGFKVAFSGTGADELVTGYYDHFNLHLYELREHADHAQWVDDWNTHVRPLVRNPHLRNPSLYIENPSARAHVFMHCERFAGFLKQEFREPFREEHFCDSLLRNRMMNELFHEVVPAILHEDDLNSMRYSIENRSPYLDSRLFEFAYSIPSEHLIRDGFAKYVLREAVKGTLNEQVRTDRRKVGFNASIGSLFDFRSRNVRERILDDGPVYELLDRAKVTSLLDQDQWTNSESKFLFSIVSARLFLDIEGEQAVPPAASMSQPFVGTAT
ncbi:MAG: asparagine synthase (glutamine-hydrolyzing) [Planctomycetes bacterium]|nr:asparagine synthase (glutamine-hydrolyzing) [Planctomycetota bacterium]